MAGELRADLRALAGGNFWSGSTRDGTVAGNNCNGWTADGQESGSFGCSGQPDGAWLCCDYGGMCNRGQAGTGDSCDTVLPLLCVGTALGESAFSPLWCPPDHFYWTSEPPSPGHTLSTTVAVSAAKVLSFGGGADAVGSTGASICVYSDVASRVAVEIRGAECANCPLRAQLWSGECSLTAPFTGQRNGLIEYCAAAAP